jgi:hypothetical protein
VNKTDNQASKKPSARNNHICLPFENEQHYTECVKDTVQYRKFLAQQFTKWPELFPAAFANGYQFHSKYRQQKQELVVRRIKLKTTNKVFAIRPSFVMPYGVAKTDEVEKPLLLLGDGVALESLTYAFGRDLHYWNRMWLGLGRPSLVGTTVKDPAKLPSHLVTDEKVTWHKGEEVLAATTVSVGCFLGVAIARAGSAPALKQAYGEFKQEAQELDPTYTPESVCSDGFKATRLAWQQLFPGLNLILCFLHGVLKINERCRGELRKQVLDRVWPCYQAANLRQFSQRFRRLSEWAARKLSGPVLEMVEKLCANRKRYQIAYLIPRAHRTTNAVDRLMNQQDRLLYARRYLHGKDDQARLALRAMAMHWNFHPYSSRVRRENPKRQSPFADLNGFQYHENWLHNLLIAASLSGCKL